MVIAGHSPRGLTLELPPAYVATSPVSRTLDALTLLSTPQTIAVFVTFAIVVFGYLALARRSRGTWKTWVARFVALVAATGMIEGFVALGPRPMAALRVSDADIVVADFHSHTGASHDVRKSYTAEDNRAWHEGAGFNVAWVTDHVKFGGAVSARAHNPHIAGEGVSLLTAVEGRYHRIMSTIILGLDERDTALLNKRGNLLPGVAARGAQPVTIVALPNRNLDSVTAESMDSIDHFVAIELVDAAPRGLGQFDREESRIRTLASKLGLTLVAASNNHGFGRTAAAWNLTSVPGWTTFTPDSLGRIIEQRLRDRDGKVFTIVMRARPRTHDASLGLTLPVMLFQIIGALSLGERVVWVAWIWTATLAVLFVRRTKRH